MSSRLMESLATTKPSDLFSDGSVLAALLKFLAALPLVQARTGLTAQCAADAISRAL